MDDRTHRILKSLADSLQKMAAELRRQGHAIDALGPRVGDIESREAAGEIEEELEGSRNTPEDSSLIGKVILVAEDEPQLQLLLSRYLDRHGAETIVVRSAAEGRQLTAHVDELYAAVIDYHLKCRESGIGLAQWVRRQWPKCRILLTSGDVDGVSQDAQRVSDLRAMVGMKTSLLPALKELLKSEKR